ncbi:MAG: Eco57I restriction-modification methylase domain-containing protein [Acidobacteriota bacterium]
MTFLLEQVLELPRDLWWKVGEVPDGLRVRLDQFDQELAPDRVLHRGEDAVLLVSIVQPDQGLDRRDAQPGRWKASPTTKLDRLLRETGVPLGLVTNGEELRLVHALQGLNPGSITWTSRNLVEEKATLDAFATLLGRRSLVPERDDALSLADLCRISRDRQGEVADQLGEQVRNGLERLIWAWDEADRASKGALLAGMSEDEIYEMGLVVMMRLVFMLYSEERRLLPHGEVLYDQGYGLTYLWHRLSQQKREAEGLLDVTTDAWGRFLATCRLIHGGCTHEDLVLPAYGGDLFDPTRFPALEDPACRITNRTFHDVLWLLLFARQRRGGEPQRVGYWNIDVEQIGYIYEGLLDHRCARAGDEVMVKLRGAGEAALPLSDLEELDEDDLVALVASQTGRKADTVQGDLEKDPEPKAIACLSCFPGDVVERVRPFTNIVQCEEVVPPGWRYLTTGTSRRASGAHYTPQKLTERIVRVTLEPLVYRNVEGKPGLLVDPREVKSPRELLDLKVCDMAMGSGAFLVQVVRYLGARLVEAWDQALAKAQAKDPGAKLTMPFAEKAHEPASELYINPDDRKEMERWAARFVAERCVYGVDVNPLAVDIAKLSLWLTTLSKDKPFTFLNHALKPGDSLVGVDLEQLRTWSIDRNGSGAPLLENLIEKAVSEAIDLRRQLQSIAVVDSEDLRQKQTLLDQADAAMARIKLAGDLIVAPSFAEEASRSPSEIRSASLNDYSNVRSEHDWPKLRVEADRLLGGQKTFHWPLEFPEVFLDEKRGGFDGFVGNPPFVGGRRMRSTLGDTYVAYLLEEFPGSSLNADLCSFLFKRAFCALREGGNLGLIATNTIGQGDTRESGLDRIAATGGTIFAAVPRMPWPGSAAVNVSVVHLSRSRWQGKTLLDGELVDSISTALDAAGLQGKPERLWQNRSKSFIGSFVNGIGFVVEPVAAKELIKNDKRNRDVLFPYLNGKDLNTSPDQSPSRWVINFFDWPLQKAESYPDCMSIVRELVYPERMKVRRDAHRKYWWHYGDKRPALYRAIAPLERVLVRPEVSRTWAFAFVPNGWVYSHMLIAFFSQEGWFFSILQGSLHRIWAEAYTSSMKADLRYAPSDCFDTFPFPQSPTKAQQGALERIGEAYHEHRRQLMLENKEGLTKTYNRFHDPKDRSPGIHKLRELHVEMDNAVRDAYGWDFDLGHGWVETRTTEEKKNKKTGKVRTVEKVEHRYTISEEARQTVLRKLLELNHEVYEREVAQGLHKGGKQKPDEADEPEDQDEEPKKPSRRGKRDKATMDLFGDDE